MAERAGREDTHKGLSVERVKEGYVVHDQSCMCCHAGLQVMSVVGILQDETDPMVSVMKVRRHSSSSTSSKHVVPSCSSPPKVHVQPPHIWMDQTEALSVLQSSFCMQNAVMVVAVVDTGHSRLLVPFSGSSS